MWWPGSSAKGEEELDPDDGSPGDGGSTPTSDFMEILSEEDILESAGATSSPLEIPASAEDAELRDLKEQFAEQENLLGQLKGVLRSEINRSRLKIKIYLLKKRKKIKINAIDQDKYQDQPGDLIL